MNRIAPKVLLGVLLKEDGPIFRTRLMKLLFLLRQQTMLNSKWAFYDFLPYKYGPYSFSVDRDIGKLEREGLIKNEDDEPLTIRKEFKERAKGVFEELPENVRKTIEGMVNAYAPLSDQQMVNNIYERYEEFTLLSELEEDRERPRANTSIYTIGYEGHTIDGLLKKLIQQGISQVVDVRKNAQSRNYGFHASTMERLCGKVGIEYRHVEELGIASEQRQELDTKEDYHELFEKYERETLSNTDDAVEKVTEWMITTPTTLLCYEADPTYCHRTKVAEAVESDSNLLIEHLSIEHE